jgi:hypothetical protein
MWKAGDFEDRGTARRPLCSFMGLFPEERAAAEDWRFGVTP